MFYEKSKSFDKKLFENPAARYRGTPFWAWNGKLNEKMLEEQINCFKEMGFGGFHIHPRAGLDEQYLGEKYMRLVEYCADKAAKKICLSICMMRIRRLRVLPAAWQQKSRVTVCDTCALHKIKCCIPI